MSPPTRRWPSTSRPPTGANARRYCRGVAGRDTPAYFVRADRFFDRPGLYGQDGGDYHDNADRFACFARAALALLARLGPYDVLHGHDCAGGPRRRVPPAAARPLRVAGFYPARCSPCTNVGYQGRFDAGVFPRLQVDAAHYWPNFEFYGDISYLKAGLSLADRLTTVSPSYAEEIGTPEQGHGLHGVFSERADDLVGIMNGADYAVWDPAADSFIARQYSAASPEGKRDCKRDLQRRLNLPPSDAPLAGMVARLVHQKGLDILAGSLDALLSRDLAARGAGEPAIRTTSRRSGSSAGAIPAASPSVSASTSSSPMPSRPAATCS